MPFHRYKDPTYDLLGGTFPGTVGALAYDRVNVVSEGVGGGDGSANADSAKSAPSPNVGTYFVAFGEDATSSFANRGLRAVAQNTDFLDDVVRSSVPGVSYFSIYLAGVNNFQIPGDVFVGDGSAGILPQHLVVVWEEFTHGYPVTPAGYVAQVQSIYDSTNTSNVFGNGWETDPTIRLATSFTGTVMVLYYGRTSHARVMEEPERDRRSASLVGWDRATKAMGLMRHGLNEHYRRGSTLGPQPADVTLNQPGAGAIIHRDGQALEVRDIDSDLDANRPDPFLALFKATKADATPTLTADSNKQGAIAYLATQTIIQEEEAGDAGENYAEFASLNYRNCDSDDVGGTDLTFTRVPKDSPAVGNPSGADNNAIDVTAPAYFWRDFSGTHRTTIREDYDLLLVQRASGKYELMYINGLNATLSNRCTVWGITGANPTFAVDEALSISLIQPSVITRCAHDKPFTFLGRPYNSTDDNQVYQGGAEFVAGSLYRENGYTTDDGKADHALRWGGCDEEQGEVVFAGWMYGDGRIKCRAIQADLHSRAPESGSLISGAGPHSRTINLYYRGSYGGQEATGLFAQQTVDPAATDAVTLNFNIYGGFERGARCTFVLNNRSPDCTFTINWGGDVTFVFSGQDDQVPGHQSGIYKWEGLYVNAGSGYQFLMTRTDYDL